MHRELRLYPMIIIVILAFFISGHLNVNADDIPGPNVAPFAPVISNQNSSGDMTSGSLTTIIPTATEIRVSSDDKNSDHVQIRIGQDKITNDIVKDVSSGKDWAQYGIQYSEGFKRPSPEIVTKYDLKRVNCTLLGEQLKLRQNITISIGPKDYETQLRRMGFEDIDDGIDSYTGIVGDVKDSEILFTAYEHGLLGRITIENETFWIMPAETINRTGLLPLHIIYNSNDATNKSFKIDDGPSLLNPTELTDIVSLDKSEISKNTNPNISQTPLSQILVVDILVVTDREFWDGGNWRFVAQNIIAEANLRLSTIDINIVLSPMYDDTRRNQLSDNTNKITDPLLALREVYPASDLNLYHRDLILYLGGNNFIQGDDPSQGASYGFNADSDLRRYAWAQMVWDDPFYIGTPHGQQVVSIHEIGHLFGACHDDQSGCAPYARAHTFWTLQLDKKTVMWHDYSETASLTHFSSNDQFWGVYPLGDENHDNSRNISETRDIVAGYATCGSPVPEVGFSWNPESAPIGTQIIFTDNTANSPAAWYWEFGDGGTSKEKNPSHTYLSSPPTSKYTVRLTAMNCAGSSSKDHEIIITNPGGSANGEASTTTPTVGETVEFTDLSTPTPSSWNWSFGDGKFSVVQNPSHIYTEEGIYTVRLDVVQSGNPSYKNFPDYINVLPQPPHANFTATPRNRIAGAPLKVQFTDRSTNVPNEWLWNFGDGDDTNATKKNPLHTYTNNGTFIVTLTATNRSTGSSGFTRTGYITVGPLYAETFRPYMVLIFNRTGSTKWIPPAGVTKVDYLVVGGGGEGGNGCQIGDEFYPGGGGGAGGVLNGSLYTVNGVQNIVVGAGGSGAGYNVGRGLNGGNSIFNTVISTGGGGGGGCNGAGSTGGNGGSGGGGSGMGNDGGLNMTGQGFAGGNGNYILPGNPAGGGGGAGAPGATPFDSAIGGPGGDGKLIDITGFSIYYGSGGGGGIGSWDSFGAGGTGCGGDGSRGTANPAKCQGTGSGGGGAGSNSSTHGAGGSGTVIIRYQTPETMPLVANFSATPEDPDSLTVTFIDLSTGSPTSWLWDFGDGDNTNSTVRNPIHQYAARGSYTASLTASNADETDTLTKSRYVTVDMRDKIGVFRNSTTGNRGFYLDNNGNITWIASEDIQFSNFCTFNNVSVSGDWNGDGRTEIGAFRNSSGATIWLLDLDGDGTLDADEGPFNFLTGDFPVTGDWNGDGKAEIGIFRNSTQRFLLDYSGDRVWQESGDRRINFSSTYNDVPVSGDWNNDGISEIGIFRNSTHSWYLNLDGDEIQDPDEGPFIYTSNSEDMPITGDWNSDGVTEMGIFRPSKGRFLLDYDNDRIFDSEDNNTVFVVGNYSVSGRW